MDIDANKYASRINVGPDTAPSSGPVSVLMDFLAAALVFLFSAYATVQFYIRQVVYSYQRQVTFRNRTPQLIRQDVAALSKVPRHVAFILELGSDLETMIQEVVESASWCLGAGSPVMTVYERTGALKAIPAKSLAEAVYIGLGRYFKNSREAPRICVRNGMEYVLRTSSGITFPSAEDTGSPDLTIIVASEQDGRPMLVKFAQEYAVSISEGKLSKSDITVEKIHEDLRERVGEEPDLLVTFGSKLDLCNFSPWLLRVTELFCLPDNNGVFHYMVFLRALQRFSAVKINLGA